MYAEYLINSYMVRQKKGGRASAPPTFGGYYVLGIFLLKYVWEMFWENVLGKSVGEMFCGNVLGKCFVENVLGKCVGETKDQ